MGGHLYLNQTGKFLLPSQTDLLSAPPNDVPLVGHAGCAQPCPKLCVLTKQILALGLRDSYEYIQLPF